jgi:hypothetical protein
MENERKEDGANKGIRNANKQKKKKKKINKSPKTGVRTYLLCSNWE